MNTQVEPTTERAASTGGWFALDLGQHLETIRRRWPLVPAVTIAVTAIAFFWTYRQPKIFSAKASVIIDPVAPQVLQGVRDVVELGTGSYWANREFYETQYKIVQSVDVIRKAIDEVGLWDDPKFPYPGAPARLHEPKQIIAAVVAATTVVPIKNSRIADILVEDRDPERAAKLANAISAAYINYNLEFKVEGTRDASVWLGDQVEKLAAELRASELSLYDYRAKNNLLDVDLDARRSMNTENVRTYNEKLAEVRVRRIELESRRNQILKTTGNTNEQESLPEVRDSAIIQQLRVAHVELLKTKAELETKYLDKHPAIAAIDKKLLAIQNDYRGEMEKLLKSVDKEFAALQDNEHRIEAVLNQEKQNALKLAKLELEYRPLTRKADNSERLYGSLLQREKETGLTGLIKSNNIRMLQTAEPPTRPIKPRMLVNVGVAILGGLFLGFVLVFAIESFDNTIKGQEDVERNLQVPVLGLMPLIPVQQGTKEAPGDLVNRDLVVHREPRSTVAEACRSIRTNVMFMSPDKRLHTLAVTSPSPQEGKTTSAISLSITMATAGNRVLLVDTDLRRPRIHKSFAVPNDRGVSNLIMENVDVDTTIQKTAIANLSVLTSGPVPPNPAELLHSKGFLELVESLKARFDWVIFDTPPTSAVTDSAIIGNLVDGTILVVRSGHTSRESAVYAKRQLLDAKANLLGTIINRVDINNRRYRYAYYRNYKYGAYEESTTGNEAARA